MTKKQNPSDKEMYEAILTLRTVEECEAFFKDLCSITELQSIQQRFAVAKRLEDGMIYNDILNETGASTATISRVNRALNYGAEGYHLVFERLKEKK